MVWLGFFILSFFHFYHPANMEKKIIRLRIVLLGYDKKFRAESGYRKFHELV